MERERDANRKDRQIVDRVAFEKGMNKQQRREFGRYIEVIKRSEGRGGADNFTYEDLLEVADEFLEL